MSSIAHLQTHHPIYYPSSLEELENLRLLHRRMLRPKTVAAHALIPLVNHQSPSRSVMSIQQASQHLVWSSMEKPVVMTGAEYEFGKHAFSDEMPEDGQIIAVVPRYPPSADPKSIRKNPEIVVIYSNSEQVVDCFSIKPWDKYHPHFGYQKRMNEKNIASLAEGRFIKKGTKFGESPGVAEDGCYMMGVNANIMYVDDERIAEDGIAFRKGFIDKHLVADMFEEIEISTGSRDFPLGMHTKADGEYGIMPEIGDLIRHDGLIMVKRKYNQMTAAVNMSAEALRTPEGISDEFVYAWPTPLREGEKPEDRIPGEIVDIVVLRNPKAKRTLPPTMCKQLERYELAYQTFLNNLIKVEDRLIYNLRKKNPTAELKTTPRFQIMLKMARGKTSHGSNRIQGPIEFQMNRARMDEWTINITVRHRRRAAKGDKFTGLFGDKGVTVQELDDLDLPPNVDGIMSASSTVGRTNLNRVFVPRISQSAVDLTEDIRNEFGIAPGKRVSEEQLALLDRETFKSAWSRLLKFYAITSPHLYYTYAHEVRSREGCNKHLFKVLNEVIHPLMPIDNPINDTDAIIHLDREGFLRPYQKVTYRQVNGKMEETKVPVPVLKTYIMYLEKIAIDGSATSFGKLQHHGLLASRTNNERYQYNYRNVATRNIGGHEFEILMHDSRSPALIAELMDRSNRPEVMMDMAMTMLTHPKPTSIERLVCRKTFPLGYHRPRQFLRHFYENQGATLSYMAEDEAAKLPILEEGFNNG